MKKTLVLSFLLLTMFGATLLANGTKEATVPSGKAAGEMEKPTLRIGIISSSFITDYENNYFTQLLEKELGCNLDFYLLPSSADEFRTKVSLMLSSGKDLPDVFITGGYLTENMITDYGSKGIFVNMKDFYNDPAKSPYFHKLDPGIQKEMVSQLTSSDGNIYSVGQYEPKIWNMTPYRFFINSAWLNTLGLPVPTTTEELYNTLIAFRDKDPNGNGKQDEIPVCGLYGGTYGQNVIIPLMNAFLYYPGFHSSTNTNAGLVLDNTGNKINASFTDPAFKEGLAYLRKLNAEGLLPASIFTDDSAQFKAKLNEEENVIGLVSAGSTSNWANANKNKNFNEMDIIPPFKGPKGVQYAPYAIYQTAAAMNICATSKNIDLAMKLADLFYREDISISSKQGEQGVDWTTDPAVLAKYTNAYVQAGAYDSLSLVSYHYIWIQKTNKFWHDENPRASTMRFENTIYEAESGTYDPSLKTNVAFAVNLKEYNGRHPEKILPNLKYTEEEYNSISEILTNVNEYVKQSVAEFIIGARSLDDWNGYLAELNKLGLQQWIATAQKAYDRVK
jgi:putative aldouronate transport system substrate-binding protein